MILVTGGTGLLGSHLLLELVREHEEVVAIKRPSSDLAEVKRVFSFYNREPEELFKLIDWVDIDLLNYAEVERVMIDIDQVYHCAGQVSFHPRNRKEMIRFNRDSTANMVNACIENRIDKMVHVSSSSTIGKASGEQAADESLIYTRNKYSTGYSVSKFRSEMEVWRGMEEGLKAVIVNPTVLLGAGFWNRGSSVMFHRVHRGLKYATPGITGFVGVRDVVMALTGLMASGISGERFILTSGDFSYSEILGLIARAMGKKHSFREVSYATLRSMARMDSVLGAFTGNRRITKEQVRAAFGETRFSNKKIRDALGMEFEPIPDVIERVAGLYLKDRA